MSDESITMALIALSIVVFVCVMYYAYKMMSDQDGRQDPPVHPTTKNKDSNR